MLERTGFLQSFSFVMAMLKVMYVLAATGVVAIVAGVPVVGGNAIAPAETRSMLLTATAFFAVAFAMRWRWKRPPRR